MSDFGTDPMQTLEPTWWIFDREQGMDDIYERAGDSLDEMVARLKMALFQDRQQSSRLFLARYEFPKHQEDFEHQDGLFIEEPVGLIDFLAGFPVECIEMLGMVGQYSTSEEEQEAWDVKEAHGPVAPVPGRFFKGIPQEKILLNLLFLPEENQSQVLMVKNLEGEIKPQKLHYWVRTNIKDGEGKFPVPGEFLGLAIRMMPDKPWGRQLSTPFIYSGNWMDTIFYTSGVVKEVTPPDDNIPYPRYKVQWRKDMVEANPSDFAEYEVGDRVTILKAVDATKTSQQWKDDDVSEFPLDNKWVICPITFYDDLGAQEG